MVFQDIGYAERDAAAWITLDRPKQLNALSARMIAELGDALTRAQDDDAVRCVVVTGAGRAFCAGADLLFVHAMPAEERAAATDDFLQRASALMSRIEAFPKPVIAAVNGVATAGGMELILCCDVVVAAASARLGDGHANYGLLPGAGASVRLPRRIGMSHAKMLFFTGDLLPASHPAFAQLVNAVVPDPELDGYVEALAAKVAAKSPLGLSTMKSLADSSATLPPHEGLALELQANRHYTASHDRNEGLAAFADRRTPVFLGR